MARSLRLCCRLLPLLTLCLSLSGCYLMQAATGQLEIVSRREPITSVLADHRTPAKLKSRLEYVAAARALGVSNWVIMVRHLLPNAMVATVTFMPFILSGSITTLTSLDFLGYGLPVGSPSLGELLSQGKENFQAPWLGITGFVSISLILTLVVFVGEGVRDAFDPRKSFR